MVYAPNGNTIGNSLKDAFKLRDDFADYLLDTLDDLGLSSEPDGTAALAEKLIVDGWVTRNPSAVPTGPLARSVTGLGDGGIAAASTAPATVRKDGYRGIV